MVTSGFTEQAGAEQAPCRIAVVDDHRLFLMGFSFLLERMERRVEVKPFESPVPLIRQLDAGEVFDLIICDLVMSGMNGLAFVDAVRGRHSVPILMLSGINSSPPISEMQHLRVQGFVHKSADDTVLQEAIKTVLSGQTYFRPDGEWSEPGLAHSYGVAENIYEDDMDVPILTRRQVQVLELISGGATNQEIALKLGISENTVKSHLKQVFEALRVTKRTACVRAARNLGIL